MSRSLRLGVLVVAVVVAVVVAAGAFWLSLGPQGDCPPILYVDEYDERPDSVADEVRNYSTLEPAQQRAFDRALTSNYTEINGSYDPWGDTPYVRHRGEVYAVSVAVC